MTSQKETNEEMILDDEQGQKDSKISDRDITMEEEYTESNTGWTWLRSLRERNTSRSLRINAKRPWKWNNV